MGAADEIGRVVTRSVTRSVTKRVVASYTMYIVQLTPVVHSDMDYGMHGLLLIILNYPRIR